MARTAGGWRRDHQLDLEFAHSELAGCVAMTVMLPLLTVASIFAALPLTIAMGTYFLAYAVFWAWRMRGRLGELPEACACGRTRGEALAQVTMGAGMATCSWSCELLRTGLTVPPPPGPAPSLRCYARTAARHSVHLEGCLDHGTPDSQPLDKVDCLPGGGR